MWEVAEKPSFPPSFPQGWLRMLTRSRPPGLAPAQHRRRRLTGTAARGAQRSLMGRARLLAAVSTWDGRHGLARRVARRGRGARWLARRPDGVAALRDAVTVPPPRPLTTVWMWSAAGALWAAAAAWRRPTGEVEPRRPAMPRVRRPRSPASRTARGRRRTVPLRARALGPAAQREAQRTVMERLDPPPADPDWPAAFRGLFSLAPAAASLEAAEGGRAAS